MSIIISYLDQFDKPVTETEATLLDRYIKVLTIDGRVRNKEHYSERGMLYIEYYLSENEIAEDVISKYSSIDLDTVEVIGHTGSYKVVLHKSYVNGNFKSATKIVENAEGNEICAYLFDESNETVVQGSITNYYFHNNEMYYAFSYYKDGSLRDMDSFNPDNMGVWRRSELDKLGGFSWEEVGSYYKTAEPFIPA